jgi:hypothetical protein
MNLFNYLRSLLPRLERNSVLKDIENIRRELREETLPSFKTAVEHFKKSELKSEFSKGFDKLFQKEVKTRFKGNYIIQLNGILNHMHENIGNVEGLVEKYFGDEIVRSSMTYTHVSLMQYIEAMSFASRYARTLLRMTIQSEIEVARQQTDSNVMTKAERQFVQINQMQFMIVMRAMDKTQRELEKIFAEIPDIEADESNARAVMAATGVKRLDPMGFSNTSGIMNPIYHFRVWRTDVAHAKYEAAKEERRQIEYMILDLQRAQEGKDDPKIQKAIEYHQSRLDKLNTEIKAAEESAR